MLKLQQRSKPDTSMWLVKSSTTIGRNSSCDFIIPSNKIAGVHIELLSKNDQLSLSDRSEGKSIFVNDLPVGQYGPLKHGDVIRLADIELEIIDPKQVLQDDEQIPTTQKTTQSKKSWQLIAIGDWLAGQQFEIRDDTVLGRDASCDITIPGTHLSRRHAEFKIVDNQLEIHDLGSSNGTYVNDRKVKQSKVKTGDQVRFDVLIFKVQGPPPDVDMNKTIVRNAISLDDTVIAANPSPSASTAEKQWKTKPTSVGNRPEEEIKLQRLHKQMQTKHHWWLYFAVTLAACLSIAYFLLQNKL